MKSFFSRDALLRSWPVLLAGFVLGVFVQLNWIEGACSGHPFIGSTRKACQDNVIRLVLGGPVFSILFMLLFTLEVSFLAKNYKIPQGSLFESKLFHRILVSHYPLFASALLPVFGYADLYLWFVLVLFFLVNFLQVTDPRLSPDYGEASFELEGNDSLVVRFIGLCNQKNEKNIYETIIDSLSVLPSAKELRILLEDAQEVDSRGKSLISILEKCADFNRLKVSYVDPKKLLS